MKINDDFVYEKLRKRFLSAGVVPYNKKFIFIIDLHTLKRVSIH